MRFLSLALPPAVRVASRPMPGFVPSEKLTAFSEIFSVLKLSKTNHFCAVFLLVPDAWHHADTE